MELSIVKWLDAMGAGPVDMVLLVMGLLFATYVIHSIKTLWRRYNKLLEKYNALDKLGYGTAIAIQCATGINVISHNADRDGDYTHNRRINAEAFRKVQESAKNAKKAEKCKKPTEPENRTT